MTRGSKVTQLHRADLEPSPDPAPVQPLPGAFGLHWTAELQRDTRRWRVVGRLNGRYVTCTEVHAAPGIVPPKDLALLTAQLLNDIGEDAGNLMLDQMQEGPDHA